MTLFTKYMLFYIYSMFLQLHNRNKEENIEGSQLQ